MGNFKELVRIGKDAVTRHTQAGKAVTGFSAAFDDGYGDDKKTVWLDCSAWGDRYTKLAEYLKKGTQVVVDGNIGTREHDGKTYLTLRIEDIKLVAKSGGGETRTASSLRQASSPRQQSAPPMDDFADDGIPF